MLLPSIFRSYCLDNKDFSDERNFQFISKHIKGSEDYNRFAGVQCYYVTFIGISSSVIVLTFST